MKRYIWLALVVLPVWVFATGITLVSQSPSQVVIDFEMPDYEIRQVDENGAVWHQIISEDGSVFGDEGYPKLISFSTAVGIPVEGDISISIQTDQMNIRPGVNLMPNPRMVLTDDEPDYVFWQDNRAYSRAAAYPELVVERGEAAFIGDRRFVPISIRPFQYRATSRELLVHSKLRIVISIHGDTRASGDWQISDNPLDTAANSFFINNSSSQNWRLARSRADDYESPKTGTNINALQFVVDSEGIYKITYQYLKTYMSMMLDSLDINLEWNVDNVDPRYLELRNEQGQVPIAFFGESDGYFNPGDYFEFYGDRHYGDTGYQDDYTAENVYTLSLIDKFGARMMVENGGLVNSNQLQFVIPDAFESSIHIEQQNVSDKLGNKWTSGNPDFYREDLWFWKKISAPNLDIIPFELQYPKDSTIRTGSAKVMLHGLTYSDQIIPGQFDHDATVRINQAMINSHSWVGQNEKLFTNQNPIPNSFFTHGTNYLYISLSGNTVMGDREQVMLDYADITYWREYKTNQDWISFTKPSNRPGGLFQFQLEGFSQNNVSVYKIGSSVFNNLQIEPFNTDGIAPWTVTFQDSVFSNSVKYYAVTESQKKLPKSIRLNFPSDLKNPGNSGDVVVVIPRQFIHSEGTQTLMDLWESEGHIVKIVDIQDIYDEFNHGIVSAEAIRDFTKYAYNNWASPRIKHLILIGEGTDDTRDNSPSRIYNQIPVKKTWTYKHGATASDNWFGCIVGTDIVADISVARISIWKPEQIADYAAKAVKYRSEPMANRIWNSHITLTAGGKISDGNDIFSVQSERIRRKNIPDHYRVSRIYTTTQTVSNDYFGGTFNLKDAINSGTSYLQFMGHGGGRVWADYNLFNFNDVATLNNQVFPIVMSLACYASAFDTNGASSISEALVLQPNKGAIATVGFSGLGYLDQDEDYGLAITEALFENDFSSVGEAMIFTKARFFTTTSSIAPRYALTNGTAYLGDPLIKLRRPQSGIPVTADNLSLNPGDTLRVSAEFPEGVSAARLHIMKDSGKIINVPFDLPVIQGSYNASYVVPVSGGTNYIRKINVTGYSSDQEYVGLSAFGVGRPSVFHNNLFPANPSWRDSTGFAARIFSNELVLSLICKARTDSTGLEANWVSLPMTADAQDSLLYRSTGFLPAQRTGKEIFYKYVLTTTEGVFESNLYNFVSAGPDLFLRDIALEADNDQLRLKVLVTNIGNASSTNTDLKLYYTPSGGTQTLHTDRILAPVAVNEERWEYIDLAGVPGANLNFEVNVNYSNAFPEWHMFLNTNNSITLALPFNYQFVGSAGAIMNSVDTNLSCEIPPGLVPSGGSSMFSINGLSALEPNLQPDIYPVKLRSPAPGTSNFNSIPYEIKTMDSSLVDSLGIFANGRRVKLTFYYNTTDSLTQQYENQNIYNVYRWDSTYRKWMRQGGNVSAVGDLVVFEVNRQGIYTIYRNQDRTGPSIDVNVQDQEFTVGGYVSGTGTISLLLSDANGINVVESSIRLFINGELVPEDDYAIAINSDNINRIPIKYQLNLPRGNYTLLVDCSDVNSNFNSRAIQFFVNDRFDIRNIGNYPNPVVGRAQDPRNDGRTRFTYVLTDNADEVTIKVYTVSGRLVKTFSGLPTGVGYHEYPRTVYGWDCKDEQGFTLANGAYFYKIIAKKGSRTLEKTMKMAILK